MVVGFSLDYIDQNLIKKEVDWRASKVGLIRNYWMEEIDLGHMDFKEGNFKE